MPELGALYLIHGDDHGGIASRRACLLALARERGDQVEVLEGERATATPLFMEQAAKFEVDMHAALEELEKKHAFERG